jgi:hypothetical protein
VGQVPVAGELEEVDARLEPVERRERLGEDEVPGRQVQAHAVLEAQVRLVVDVDRDLVLAHDLLEPRRVHPEREVEQVVVVLDVAQDVLAVRRGAPHEQRLAARPAADASRRDEEPVAHGQRDGPPHGQHGVGGVRDEGVEGHHAVEPARVDLAELPQPPREVLVAHARRVARQRLGEHAERARRQVLEEAGGDDLRAEDDDHVGTPALEDVPQPAGVGVLAELDEGRLDAARGAWLERAGLEEGALADEGDAHEVRHGSAAEGRPAGT